MEDGELREKRGERTGLRRIDRSAVTALSAASSMRVRRCDKLRLRAGNRPCLFTRNDAIDAQGASAEGDRSSERPPG